jgi:hypothetical protein
MFAQHCSSCIIDSSLFLAGKREEGRKNVSAPAHAGVGEYIPSAGQEKVC